MSSKKRKVRVAFQKNREKRARRNNLTRDVDDTDFHPETERSSERMTGKGALTRHRTIIVDENEEIARQHLVDEGVCFFGRVLMAIGLTSHVRTDSGERFECTVRRVVRTRARQSRNAVVTGDRVLIRPSGHRAESGIPQAVIEWIEPRYGIVARGHNNREHILAANVDQALVVASAAMPPLKLSLIDRFLLSCELGSVTPIICINKVDLVPDDRLAPIAFQYRQLGYRTLLTSATRGDGIEELRGILRDRTTVVAGQSGVGKSSLLNAIDPGLDLKTGGISAWAMKGTHTTRRSELMPLKEGGFIIDTPGIRQFQLWDVDPAQIDGLFVEFARYVPQCHFPDCTHMHEQDCIVKRAVDLGLITSERYLSYQRIFAGIED